MTPGLRCLGAELFPTEKVSLSFLLESSDDIRIPRDQGPGRQHPPTRSQSGILPLPGAGRPQAPPPRGAWPSAETPVGAGPQGAPLTRRGWDEWRGASQAAARLPPPAPAGPARPSLHARPPARPVRLWRPLQLGEATGARTHVSAGPPPVPLRLPLSGTLTRPRRQTWLTRPLAARASGAPGTARWASPGRWRSSRASPARWVRGGDERPVAAGHVGRLPAQGGRATGNCPRRIPEGVRRRRRGESRLQLGRRVSLC